VLCNNPALTGPVPEWIAMRSYVAADGRLLLLFSTPCFVGLCRSGPDFQVSAEACSGISEGSCPPGTYYVPNMISTVEACSNGIRSPAVRSALMDLYFATGGASVVAPAWCLRHCAGGVVVVGTFSVPLTRAHVTSGMSGVSSWLGCGHDDCGGRSTVVL
jgi:hypothetical protein